MLQLLELIVHVRIAIVLVEEALVALSERLQLGGRTVLGLLLRVVIAHHVVKSPLQELMVFQQSILVDDGILSPLVHGSILVLDLVVGFVHLLLQLPDVSGHFAHESLEISEFLFHSLLYLIQIPPARN